jgi:hypothetical protein
VEEEVVVEPLGGNRHRLLQSPGLVLGLAAGDVFEVGERGECRVLERGRNVCIQIFFRADGPSLEARATEGLAALKGRLDGKTAKELVYTVPVSSGFTEMERVLADLVSRFPGAEWYYGNVYDPNDGVTPLNWW